MSEFSTQAVQAKKFLQAKGFEVSHSLMLEMFSVLEGFRDYQTRKGVLEQSEAPALNQEPPALMADPTGSESSDFVLSPEHISAWIRVENQLVYLVRTDEGLVVDVYAVGDLHSPLASTYSFTQEAVDEHLEYAKDFDVNDIEFELVKSLCKSAGLIVEPDSDQEGLWVYKIHNASGAFVEGCEYSFDSEKEAWMAAYQEQYAQRVREFTPASKGR